MQILAAFSVEAEAFEGKVDARLGFVVGRNMRFGTDFELGVRECALIEIKYTL